MTSFVYDPFCVTTMFYCTSIDQEKKHCFFAIYSPFSERNSLWRRTRGRKIWKGSRSPTPHPSSLSRSFFGSFFISKLRHFCNSKLFLRLPRLLALGFSKMNIFSIPRRHWCIFCASPLPSFLVCLCFYPIGQKYLFSHFFEDDCFMWAASVLQLAIC